MKPAIIFPLDDKSGTFFSHLKTIRPALEELFARAFVSMSPAARAHQPEYAAWLESDAFFEIVAIDAPLSIGDHFRRLFSAAAGAAQQEQILHIGFIDRLAFTLQHETCKELFANDVCSLTEQETPIIFQRSEAAWATHPDNYREIEEMIRRTGELLFGNSLDYAWCQIAMQAGDLREVMQKVKSSDMSLLAEMILACRTRVQTRQVEWLIWEDPFILGREAGKLRRERSRSRRETEKRLSYAIPMLEKMLSASLREIA